MEVDCISNFRTGCKTVARHVMNILHCVFMSQYLKHRRIRVRIGTTFSDELHTEIGIPTGGVLSVTCFGIKNVFPTRRLQRKPLVSDTDMHHGTCVTHVPWCLSGSLTCDGGENVPGIPGACAPTILRIWQEAHEGRCYKEVRLYLLSHWGLDEKAVISHTALSN